MAGLALGTTAFAAVNPVANRALLSPNDEIDWATTGAAFDLLSNPFSGTSTGGLGYTISKTAPGDFERVDEGAGLGWLGNFAVGDALLSGSLTPTPFSITFALPVTGLGFQVQPDVYVSGFSAQVDLFDNGNGLLGSFFFAGDSTAAQDNSALFIGLLSDFADIARMELDVFLPNGDRADNFALNEVSLNDVPEAETSAAAVFVGLVGASVIRRRLNRA
jgi:hypothetical protein